MSGQKERRRDCFGPPYCSPSQRFTPRGMYVDGGPGSEQANTPEFGWDHARTHRVEPMEGGGSILWLNDRCFVVLYGMIPFPMCGIGKIPVRGDLFDHMRDSKRQEPNAHTAP
jgi:hypothetical protein